MLRVQQTSYNAYTMTRFHLPSRYAALTALLCFASLAADRRPIAETDIHAFQWIANTKISPDGSRIVYVHVAVNAKHDNYDTALWMVPTAGGTPRQLTSGPRDSSTAYKRGLHLPAASFRDIGRL